MKMDELMQAIEHCMNDESCLECSYFQKGDGSRSLGCLSLMLQDIHDFLTYHEAIIEEAERKVEKDGKRCRNQE